MTYDTKMLAALGTLRSDLATRLAALTPQLHAEIYAAHDAGVGTVEIARLAGITRDAVRQLINRRARVERSHG
jgi:DNA-directed RNA polymerase specialized sigma24 family protein